MLPYNWVDLGRAPAWPQSKSYNKDSYSGTLQHTTMDTMNNCGTTTGYRYYNCTKPSLNEKLYPIGKGWSWKLPYVEKENNKTYVYLTDGGKYEVENGQLKDSTWLGLQFAEDTSLSVAGATSKYVLRSVDGNIKQYFTNEGHLLQIKDGYNNTVTFTYTQHPTYGRKLLSRVSDAIGNHLDIDYTPTAVT